MVYNISSIHYNLTIIHFIPRLICKILERLLISGKGIPKSLKNILDILVAYS